MAPSRYKKLSFQELKSLMRIPEPNHELIADALIIALHNARSFPKRHRQFEHTLSVLLHTYRPITLACLKVINAHPGTWLTPDLASFCVHGLKNDGELKNMRFYFNALDAFEPEVQVPDVRALWVIIRTHSDLGVKAVLRVMYANRFEGVEAQTEKIMNVVRFTHDPATLVCIDYFIHRHQPLLDLRFAWLCMEKPQLVKNVVDDLIPLRNIDSVSLFAEVLGFKKNPFVKSCLRQFGDESWVLAACTFCTDPFALSAMMAVQLNRIKHEIGVEYAHMRAASKATKQEHVDCLKQSTSLLTVSAIQSCVETGMPLAEWTSKDVDDTDGKTGGIECPICLDAIDDQTLYEWPGCCHEFHSDCIMHTRLRQQVGTQFCCPICRRPDA
jgi:hypothetical protein